MALGDREVERKTLHQSAEGKGPCPTGVPLSGQQPSELQGPGMAAHRPCLPQA